MKNIKLYVIIIILLLSPQLIKVSAIIGNSNTDPYRVYDYYYAIGTGGVRSIIETQITWKVTNGKIRDSNGNFTLNSLQKPTLSEAGRIYVIWDDVGRGKLEIVDYYGSCKSYLDVYIRSSNIVIDNLTYGSWYFQEEEAAYLTLKNVTVKSSADLSLNGYMSVRLLPGVKIEPGAKVRIYNDRHLDDVFPYGYSIGEYSLAELQEDNRGADKAKLYTDISASSGNVMTIPCYIPQGSANTYINIYSSSGGLMAQKKIDSVGKSDVCISTSGWINGIYFYSLIVDGRMIDTKKVVVTK